MYFETHLWYSSAASQVLSSVDNIVISAETKHRAAGSLFPFRCSTTFSAKLCLSTALLERFSHREKNASNHFMIFKRFVTYIMLQNVYIL